MNRVRSLAALADFSEILERSYAGVILRDADGVIVDCNETACTILGVRRDEFIGLASGERAWDAVNEDGSARPASQSPSVIVAETREPLLGVVFATENGTQARRWLRSDTFPLFRDDAPRAPLPCSSTSLRR